MYMVGRSSFWVMPLLEVSLRSLIYLRDETKMQDSIFERLQGGPEGVERRDARNKVSGGG